jgi:hypothetical protein
MEALKNILGNVIKLGNPMLFSYSEKEIEKLQFVIKIIMTNNITRK